MYLTAIFLKKKNVLSSRKSCLVQFKSERSCNRNYNFREYAIRRNNNQLQRA